MNNKRGWESEMQLGFERREVWTLLYQRLLPPTFLPPRIQATTCMMSALNQFLQPKNSFSWLSHKEKNPTQCSAKFITRPLLPIEYLGQKTLEIYIPPPPTPPPPIKDRKIAQFGFCAASSSTFLGGGGGGEAVGLLSHFILSKIAVKITVRGKVCTCK